MRALIKKLILRELFRQVEPLGHLFEAIILNIIHGFPTRGVKVIGITGTNGKTTTAFLVQRMMHLLIRFLRLLLKRRGSEGRDRSKATNCEHDN